MLISKLAKKKSTKNTSKVKAKPPPPPQSEAPSINAYRPVRSAEQETNFLDQMLNNMDQIPVEAPPKRASRKRKPSPANSDREFSSPIKPGFKYRSYADLPSSDGPMDDGVPFTIEDSPHKRPRMEESDGEVMPTTQEFAQLGVASSSDEFDGVFTDFSDAELMELDEQPLKKEEKENSVPMKTSRPIQPTKKPDKPEAKPAWLSVYESLAVEPSEDTLSPVSGNSPSSNLSNISALEPDGSLRFFWLDYLELEGKLYFIGKLKDKTSGVWVSCCVTVENIERNIYILPRTKRVELVGEELVDTDIIPSEEDIHNDFDIIRKQLGIKSWRGKFVSRNYAFGEEDIPRGEAQWMKVVYGFHGASRSILLGVYPDGIFSEKQVPNNACSENISRIMGTSTNAFELLVLKRKIMGPCWIQIKNPQMDNKGVGLHFLCP